MTPTEQHFLSKYTRTQDPTGKAIKSFYKDSTEVVLIFDDDTFLKLEAERDYDCLSLSECGLGLWDLFNMDLISRCSWEQHKAEQEQIRQQTLKDNAALEVDRALRFMGVERLEAIHQPLLIKIGQEWITIPLEEVQRVLRKLKGASSD